MKNSYCLVRCGGFLSAVFYLFFTANLLHAQWIQSGLEGFFVRTITVTGSNIFVGTSGDGIYRSSNNGISWTQVNSGLTNLYIYAFAVSGSNLFAGTEGDGIFLSTNNGASWIATGTLTNPFVFALTVSGMDVYAGTDGDGIFRSTNNGSSWTNASIGMTNTRVFSLVVSGTNLFAGTFGGGVFLSTNNGTSWISVSSGLTNTDVWTIALSSGLPGNLFCGTSNGVFLSTNNGTNWTSVSSGLTSTYIHTFAFSGTNIFAGTDVDGVFRSSNRGTNWIAVSEGLTKTNIWALAVSGSSLFAGINGSGVWRRPLSEILTSVKGLTTNLPANFRLEQNYPNPFNPVTNLEFGISNSGFVSLKVYNIIGKEVATVVNENLNPGTYMYRFDASELSSGIYFYTLKTNGFSKTKRMILMK
jgi:ligand-binding sensor domain-containing protein